METEIMRLRRVLGVDSSHSGVYSGRRGVLGQFEDNRGASGADEDFLEEFCDFDEENYGVEDRNLHDGIYTSNSNHNLDQIHLQPAPQIQTHSNCCCLKIIQEYKTLTGPLGMKIAEAFSHLKLPNFKYSVNSYGIMMYYITAYFSYKRSIMGEEVCAKGFERERLGQMFGGEGVEKRVKAFIEELPDFKIIRKEIDRIYEIDQSESKKYKTDYINTPLLRINDHLYSLLAIKLTLDCHYLSYTYTHGPTSAPIISKILPLQLKFFRIINKMDLNLDCDLTEAFKRVATRPLVRQLRKLGCVHFWTIQEVKKGYKIVKEKMKRIKKMQEDAQWEKMYS